MNRGGTLNSSFDDGKLLGTSTTQTIACSRFDQQFKHTFSHVLWIATFGNRKNVFERTTLISLGNNRRDRRFADSFDGTQTKGQLIAKDREFHVPDIDVGWQNINSHATAIVNVFNKLVGFTEFA